MRDRGLAGSMGMSIEPKTRKKLEALLWRHTHRDFRGSNAKDRTIMKFMPGLGTCLVAISSLTDLELLASMPKKVVIQVSETHPTKWTTLRAYIVEDVKFYELYDMIADKMKGPAFSPEELGVA